MADISLEEIDRWINSTATEPEEVASRAYIAARNAHTGGKRPGWCSANWHDLPKDYREFLVSMVKAGIDTASTDPHHGGKLTIEQYHAEINRLAVARKLIADGEAMYDAEAWRDGYDDGMSPGEALDEEMAVMAEM